MAKHFPSILVNLSASALRRLMLPSFQFEGHPPIMCPKNTALISCKPFAKATMLSDVRTFYFTAIVDQQLTVNPYFFQIRRNVVYTVFGDIYITFGYSSILFNTTHRFAGLNLFSQFFGFFDNLSSLRLNICRFQSSTLRYMPSNTCIFTRSSFGNFFSRSQSLFFYLDSTNRAQFS